MRRNAEYERRLIYTAIEGITNTPTARKYGRGATTNEIQQYTKFGNLPVDASLKFLVRHGLINNLGIRKKGWYIKNAPPDNFCWLHGIQETFGGKCLKCLNKEGR